MNYKTLTIISIVLALGGYAVGRYMQPPKVVTKEVEKIKEVEVIKRDVKTVIKEVVRPDGSKETTTTIDESTRENNRRQTENQREVAVVPQKPQWKAGIAAKTSLTNIIPVYGFHVERRVLGPFFVGVQGWGDQSAGLSLSMEF